MEELESEEVKEFVDAQAAVANTVLSTCEHRGRLRGQLTELFDHPRFRAPFKRRGSYFYFHNPGLKPHNTLFVQVFVVVVPNLIELFHFTICFSVPF